MIKTIILAAGEGTRMKSGISKVMHKILNRELISYIIDAAKIDNSKTIIIAGKNKTLLEEKFGENIIVEQKIGDGIPYGTGYAVSCAKEYIGDDDDIVILNGDIPLIKNQTIKEFIRYHIENNFSASILTTELKDSNGYGRIVRDKDTHEFEKIVEEKDANEKEKLIKEINIGIYAFKGKDLKYALSKIKSDNKQNELYLTDCLSILKKEKKRVGAFLNEDYKQFYGINNKSELERATRILRRRINNKFMLDGVIIDNIDMVNIDSRAKIGKDTVISGSVKILGFCTIGENCFIEGSSRIVNSTIEDNVKIDNSVIEDSFVGKNTDIGPYSHLRPKAHLAENVHIGNFVEVKNSNVGKGTKAGHLAYVGDSDLGEDINIGCGVIFVNYDGKFKHRSIVKDGAFIGSNSNIVAPVNIEKEAYIAAGSTITKDIGQGELSVERAKQVNISGYVEKKKKRDLEKLKEKK